MKYKLNNTFMNNTELLELYLCKMYEFCGEYETAYISGLELAGMHEIKLQDVYIHIPMVEWHEYMKNESFYISRTEWRNGNYHISDKFICSLFDDKIRIDKNERESRRQKTKNSKFIRKLLKLKLQKNTNLLDNHIKANCENEKKEQKQNWIWILSEPGGGKTTMMKMYGLAYTYKYYNELFGENKKLFTDCDLLEKICDDLGVNEGAFPLFISVRELIEEDYPKVAEFDGFNKVIYDTIKKRIGKPTFEWDIVQFWSYIKNPIYIIDGIEWSNFWFIEEFLKGLKAVSYKKNNKCLLSSRIDEYCMIKECAIPEIESEGKVITTKEYIIPSLCYYPADKRVTIREFAKKWYESFNRIFDRDKIDIDKEFLTPLYKIIPNARELLSNPFELSIFLMESYFGAFSIKETDFVEVYRRSIELWLGMIDIRDDIYEDVLRQLSYIAYKKTVLTKSQSLLSFKNEGLKYDMLVNLIRQARVVLKSDYNQKWPVDEPSISDFIALLLGSGLIRWHTGIDPLTIGTRNWISAFSTITYYFISWEYQAYFVAYCIVTNNFSDETRKKKRRWKYVEEHISENNEFWNLVIVMILVLDSDSYDNEIIDNTIELLFTRSETILDSSESDNSNYVSILIQLAKIKRICFTSQERQKLFSLIVQNKKFWKLFRSKKVDLQRIFDLNEDKTNNYFIEIAIKKYNELPEIDKGEFKKYIADNLFYCIWFSAVKPQCIREVLITFFKNYISLNVIEMLYNSRNLTENSRKVIEILNNLGKTAFEKKHLPDFYLLIAAIEGYVQELNIYDFLDKLIKHKDYVANIIAVNILVIASWLIQYNKASDYGYEIKPGDLVKYSGFILQGILNDKNRIIQKKHLMIFSNIFSSGEMIGYENVWLKKKVFEYIIYRAIIEYKDNKLLFIKKRGVFNRFFEHISIYPCEYTKLCKKVIKDMEYDVKDIIEKFKDTSSKANSLIDKVRAVKLLILFSEIRCAEIKKILKKLERDIKVNKYGKNDKYIYHEKAVLLCIEQIKTYVQSKNV